MAPTLDNDQHLLLQSMLLSGRYTGLQIVNMVKCSERSVRSARSNLQNFGSTRAPNNGAGRHQKMTAIMIEVLCEHLEKNPITIQSELPSFVEETSVIKISACRIVEALSSVGWSTNVAPEQQQEPHDPSVDSASNLGNDYDSEGSPGHVDKKGVTRGKGAKARVRRRLGELRSYSTQGWGFRYRRKILLLNASKP